MDTKWLSTTDDAREATITVQVSPPPAPIRDARYHVVRAATEFEGYQIDRRSAVGKYILAGEHLLEARKVAAAWRVGSAP